MRLAMILGAAAALLAPTGGAFAQNAEAGQRVFNQCRACHSINQGGRNGVGPNLYGVWDRQAGQVQGFRYSANLMTAAQGGLKWDEATLRRYLTNPKDVLPQGSMVFAGIRNEEQMNNLLAWLRQVSTAAN